MLWSVIEHRNKILKTVFLTISAGLENLHLLTRVPQELRIDLRHNSQRVHATYDDVTISDEASGYVIQGGNYNGNAGAWAVMIFNL